LRGKKPARRTKNEKPRQLREHYAKVRSHKNKNASSTINCHHGDRTTEEDGRVNDAAEAARLLQAKDHGWDYKGRKKVECCP
jgi:hypothetical protein